MRTLILYAVLPLFLLGGCSTLQGVADKHDAHHPKDAPATQNVVAPAATPDAKANSDMMTSGELGSSADMMKNCPMMKSDGKPMGTCPPTDGKMMTNCPMMQGDKAGMPMSGGTMSGKSDGRQMMGSGAEMMQKCPMMGDKPKDSAPH